MVIGEVTSKAHAGHREVQKKYWNDLQIKLNDWISSLIEELMESKKIGTDFTVKSENNHLFFYKKGPYNAQLNQYRKTPPQQQDELLRTLPCACLTFSYSKENKPVVQGRLNGKEKLFVRVQDGKYELSKHQITAIADFVSNSIHSLNEPPKPTQNLFSRFLGGKKPSFQANGPN